MRMYMLRAEKKLSSQNDCNYRHLYDTDLTRNIVVFSEGTLRSVKESI